MNKLGYFHVGESGLGYVGTGNIDFDRVFRGAGTRGDDRGMRRAR